MTDHHHLQQLEGRVRSHAAQIASTWARLAQIDDRMTPGEFHDGRASHDVAAVYRAHVATHLAVLQDVVGLWQAELARTQFADIGNAPGRPGFEDR